MARSEALGALSAEFEKLYAKFGRPSIAPEKCCVRCCCKRFYSVRPEQRLMEQLGYNLLFRWFVGLSLDAAVWDVAVWNVTVFTKNRERLIEGGTRRTATIPLHLSGGLICQRARASSHSFSRASPWRRHEPWLHWLVYKIPAEVDGLPEGFKHMREPEEPAHVLQARNSLGNVGYDGPQGTIGRKFRYHSPSGAGQHVGGQTRP